MSITSQAGSRQIDLQRRAHYGHSCGGKRLSRGQDRIPRDTRRARHCTTPRRPAVRRRPAEPPALAGRRSPHPPRHRHCAPSFGGRDGDSRPGRGRRRYPRPDRRRRPNLSRPLPSSSSRRRNSLPRRAPRLPPSPTQVLPRPKRSSRLPRATAAGPAGILGTLISTSAEVQLPSGHTASTTTPWPTRRRGLAAGGAPVPGPSVMGGDHRPRSGCQQECQQERPRTPLAGLLTGLLTSQSPRKHRIFALFDGSCSCSSSSR
jgi:hypothetical protein